MPFGGYRRHDNPAAQGLLNTVFQRKSGERQGGRHLETDGRLFIEVANDLMIDASKASRGEASKYMAKPQRIVNRRMCVARRNSIADPEQFVGPLRVRVKRLWRARYKGVIIKLALVR